MRYRARLPPSASISFHLVRSLALSFSLIPVLRAASFFARRIQFLPSQRARTHSQSSPPTSRTSSARISISMRPPLLNPQKSIRSPPFNITRSPSLFAAGYVSFEPRIEKRVVSISSARPYVLRPEVENYRRNTEAAARLTSPKSIILAHPPFDLS